MEVGYVSLMASDLLFWGIEAFQKFHGVVCTSPGAFCRLFCFVYYPIVILSYLATVALPGNANCSLSDTFDECLTICSGYILSTETSNSFSFCVDQFCVSTNKQPCRIFNLGMHMFHYVSWYMPYLESQNE